MSNLYQVNNKEQLQLNAAAQAEQTQAVSQTVLQTAPQVVSQTAPQAAPQAASQTLVLPPARDIANFEKNSIDSYLNSVGPFVPMSIICDKDARECLIGGLMDTVNQKVLVENTSRSTGNKVPVCKRISVMMAAEILRRTGDFKRVRSSTNDSSMLCMRQRLGKDMGIYKPQEKNASELSKVIRLLNPDADKRFRSEVYDYLEDVSPGVDITYDSKIVWCSNGVYSFYDREKGLNPFTSYTSAEFEEKYGNLVVLRKLSTDYNPAATNVIIHNDEDGTDWDLESHLKSPFSDERSAKLWLEICHFAIRGDSGGRAWWFMNAAEGTTGNAVGGNGKNGQTDLLMHTVGDDKVLKTSIEALGDNYALGYLPEKMAIISDESDSTTRPVDKCSIYKNLTRGQAVPCRKIYGEPFEYVYHGAMIQCINGEPKVREKTDSFFRKVEVIRFDKEFVKNGKERRYINEDYIKRKEVLEYFLKKLLDMDCLEHYTDEYIQAVQGNKEFVRTSASPVFQFMEEISSEFEWDFIPFELLWDIFQVWEKCNKMHYEQEKKQFISEVRQWARHNEEWEEERKNRHFGGIREPIVAEYACMSKVHYATNLNRWLTWYDGVKGRINPDMRKTYRGGIAKRPGTNTNQTAVKLTIEDMAKDSKYDNYLQYRLLCELQRCGCNTASVKNLYEILLGRKSLEDDMSYQDWEKMGKTVYNWNTGKCEHTI